MLVNGMEDHVDQCSLHALAIELAHGQQSGLQDGDLDNVGRAEAATLRLLAEVAIFDFHCSVVVLYQSINVIFKHF